MFFKCDNNKIKETLEDINVCLSRTKSEELYQLKYSKIIESLMYDMKCTRSNLAYLASKLSRFTINPCMYSNI